MSRGMPGQGQGLPSVEPERPSFGQRLENYFSNIGGLDVGGLQVGQDFTEEERNLARNRGLQQFLYALSAGARGEDPLAAGLEVRRMQEQQQLTKEQKEFQKQINEQIDLQDIPESQKTLLKRLSPQEQYTALYSIDKAKERRIVKGADGYNYYADTGERVLPGVVQDTDKPKEFAMKQDVAGYWRYTEGPQKGERVFAGVEKPEEKPDIKDESSLRKEFNAESKTFKDISGSYAKVLATDPTAAGDVSLIFQYMKMLDPGSVVREGEQATAAQARGVPEAILSLYNRLVTGERLTAPQREDFRNQAQNIYYNALEDQSLNVIRYTGIAQDKGFKPSNIIFDYSVNIPLLEFENELEKQTVNALQELDPSKYDEKQLKIIAKVLAKKLKEGS